MENPTGPSKPNLAAGSAKPLPADYASRIASKVVFTAERERDPNVAMEKLSTFLLRNLGKPDRVKYFADTMEVLIDDAETARFSGFCWVSIVLDRQDDPQFEKMLSDVLDSFIEENKNGTKEPYQLEYKRKGYSAHARILGDSFIAGIAINNELYEVLSTIYSLLIRKEMELEAMSKGDEPQSRRIRLGEDEDKSDSGMGKKLFDDMVDYVHARGEVRTGTLQQQNPNEFISVLADRLRSTRRYVIQDILNTQAMLRRKESEKELSEKLASAEEITQAKDNFSRGMNLYWMEKQYNFKYLSVEKVRVTLQISGVIIGILHFLIGYLGIGGMKWWEGLIIAVSMYIFARIFCSRNYFQRFFPSDVSKELEVTIGSFTPVLRKMSRDQLEYFINYQVREPENQAHLVILPEFFRYIFAVMPDRKNVLVEKEELAEVTQNMEIEIARTLRTSSTSGSSFYAS